MRAPGVYVEEAGDRVRPIAGVSTTVTAFIGAAARGPAGRAKWVRSWRDYETRFGGLDGGELGFAVRCFFENGGSEAVVVRIGRRAAPARWLSAMRAAAGCDLLVLPGLRSLSDATHPDIAEAAAVFCGEQRIFLILDPPVSAASVAAVRAWANAFTSKLGEAARNVAVYWPDLIVDFEGGPRPIAPGGAAAGVYARTDRLRGVWKAPAGVEAVVKGISGTAARLFDVELGQLAEASINPVRHSRDATTLWGARTLLGGASQWKYVPVRRLFIFLERSIDKGLQWVVFEPNGEPLWMEAHRLVENFMHGLWREGAFQGSLPREFYYVRCGRTTMTQDDIDSGRLIVEVGFAPVRPAEFVVFRIGLWTADADPDED